MFFNILSVEAINLFSLAQLIRLFLYKLESPLPQQPSIQYST